MYKQEESKQANIQSNILNFGYVAKRGNWIYGTVNGYAISKRSLDGSKCVDIYNNGHVAANVYVVGKEIYFLEWVDSKEHSTTESYLCKIKEGQKKPIRILKYPVKLFYIYRGQIYAYVEKYYDQYNNNGDFRIIKTNLKGKNTKLLYKGNINYSYGFFAISNNNLYFLKNGTNQLIKYDIEKENI